MKDQTFEETVFLLGYTAQIALRKPTTTDGA
jgi:hypothetical protein